MSSLDALPLAFRHLRLADGIRSAASRNPARLAYRHGKAERHYGELIDRIDRVTAALVGDLGLQPGDHGAIVAKNSIAYMEVVLGAAQAGIALATINPKLAPAEIAAICEDAQARVLFTDKDNHEMAGDLDLPGVERSFDLGEEFDTWLSKAKAGAPPTVPEWSEFTIPYTSGTTGKPKGVLVPNRSRALSMFAMAIEYGCYSPEDRFLAIAPMCHGAGMIFALAPVFCGGHAEIMDSFDPELVLRRLRDGQMTGFFGVPTHFHALLGLPKATLDAQRPEHLTSVISNAAPLPQAVKERLVDYFGEGKLHETYGSTEAGIVTNLRPADQLRKKACVGQPIACTQVEIRHDDGGLCEPDEVGELFSTSPYLFNGYWQKPAATAEAFHDAWVTVGDLAKRDEEGYVYIVDRKKDMVISGGVNIYPREVEEVLLTHPDIRDVAVIGVPHEKWGESLKAFIVTGGGQSIDADIIADFCAEHISRMKIPRSVETLDVIPRNASGKVLKTDLRAREQS